MAYFPKDIRSNTLKYKEIQNYAFYKENRLVILQAEVFSACTVISAYFKNLFGYRRHWRISFYRHLSAIHWSWLR